MTRPDAGGADATGTDATGTDATEPAENEKKSRFAWVSKIPPYLPGGLRTTTVGLIVLFFAVLVLWNGVRYDPTLNENSPLYVPPTTEEVEPEPQPTVEPEPTVTGTPTPTSSPTGATTVPNTPTQQVPETTDTATTAPGTTESTQRPPGIQLPAIPGLPLPPASGNQ